MNRLHRLMMTVVLVVANLLVTLSVASAMDPLPGTCGLPGTETMTYAFGGTTQTTDVPVFDFDIKACQSGTLHMSFVLGCGPDYYSLNPGHGALNLSLAQAGFRTPNGSNTTLLDVLSHTGGQPHDTYLVQAVTAYLNSLYVDGYAYNAQAVLDGYHGREISEGSFSWHNHGATSQFVVPNCPLSSVKGSTD